MVATLDGGTVWLLRLLDVADLIHLEQARARTVERGGRRGERTIRGPEKGPGGVVLATPPLDLDLDPITVAGISARVRARVFDFGVISVRLAIDVAPGTSCDDLVRLAARLDRVSAEIDAASLAVWKRLAPDLGDAMRGAHEPDLIEDYLLFEINHVAGTHTADEALAALGPARLLLAEPDRALAPNIMQGYLGRAIQYYADDAAIIGWNAALVIDPEGSREELEVLEIATARLLELRFYDRLLGRELAALYTSAEAARASTTLFRSPFVRVARRAATLYIEVADLYDRVEAAITLVGDAYTARLYREAAERFRLDEISAGVRDKLGTLARVSEILQGEISNRRALLLETIVVVLIVLEVLLSFVRVH